MRRFDDETLVAFVDGELDEDKRAAVASAIETDPETAARVRAFRDSAVLVRAAFADVVDEPVPDRLIQAARGRPAEGAAVVPLRRRGGMSLRHWLALPLAASLAALAIGLGAGYWAGKAPIGRSGIDQAQVNANLVDNLAGYYDLYTVGSAGDQQLAFADIQTDEREGLQSWLTRRLERETRVPDLTSYGYSLRGGRIVISEGRPAGQIIYENPQDKRPIAI
ncbi:MAG: anti-sigma factor, partial [Alphaproteobacteria bacterium]